MKNLLSLLLFGVVFVSCATVTIYDSFATFYFSGKFSCPAEGNMPVVEIFFMDLSLDDRANGKHIFLGKSDSAGRFEASLEYSWGFSCQRCEDKKIDQRMDKASFKLLYIVNGSESGSRVFGLKHIPVQNRKWEVVFSERLIRSADEEWYIE